MNRLLLGACLACFIAANSGCCHPRSHWLGWKACGPGCGGGCGSCGGGCCEESCAPCDDCGSCNDCGGYDGCPDCSACTPWGCRFGRPGGCGEFYWGDWCTGNPHCQTCDNCANFIGPDSPGGAGQPPNLYSKSHPYGNQVVGGKTMPPNGYAPQIVRRMNPKQYSGPRASQVAQHTAPAEKQNEQPAPVAAEADQATPVGYLDAPPPLIEEQPERAPPADRRELKQEPQRTQRVSAVEFNEAPRPQYSKRMVQNRYGPPQQVVRRPKENPFGGPVSQVANHQPSQRVMQATPQQMQQRAPQFAPQQMQQRPPQQMSQQMAQPMQQRSPQRSMRRGAQMEPQMAPPRGQAARTGNPREYEGATEYLGTTDRIVTPEEAQRLGAGPPPKMPPDRIVNDPEVSERTIRQAQERHPLRRK